MSCTKNEEIMINNEEKKNNERYFVAKQKLIDDFVSLNHNKNKQNKSERVNILPRAGPLPILLF